jgi:hypothetical protein
MKKDKKENIIYAETIDGTEYYIDTVPTKEMVYRVYIKDKDGNLKLKSGDIFTYLDEKMKSIVLTERRKYFENKVKVETL